MEKLRTLEGGRGDPGDTLENSLPPAEGTASLCLCFRQNKEAWWLEQNWQGEVRWVTGRHDHFGPLRPF
jgi:hypothetical protein